MDCGGLKLRVGRRSPWWTDGIEGNGGQQTERERAVGTRGRTKRKKSDGGRTRDRGPVVEKEARGERGGTSGRAEKPLVDRRHRREWGPAE